MKRDSDLLSLKQISAILGVSNMSVYRMLRDGRLRGSKIGGQWRVHRSVVDEWLEQHRPPTLKALPPEDRVGHGIAFERKYKHQLQQYFAKILETRPDIAILEGRGPALLFDDFGEIPSGFTGIICYKRALDFLSTDELVGKRIVIIDDTVQHGSTLRFAREELLKRVGGRGKIDVDTYAFIGLKSFLDMKGEKLDEPGVIISSERCLSDHDYARATAELQEYALLRGRTPDKDHLFLQMKLTDGGKGVGLRKLIDLLDTFGSVYIVPSPAEEKGVATITLDQPNFFAPSKLGMYSQTGFGFDFGVTKLRIYWDSKRNVGWFVPVIFADVKFNLAVYLSVPWRRELPFSLDKLTPRYGDLEEWQQARICYWDLLLNLSTTLLEEFLRQVVQTTSFEISWAEPRINRADLQRCYGMSIGDSIADSVVERVEKIITQPKGKPRYQRLLDKDWTPSLPSRMKARIRERIYGELSASRPLLKCLEEGYEEEAKKSDTPRWMRMGWGCNFRKLVENLKGTMTRRGISKALDFCIDRLLIAPVTLTPDSSASNGMWRFQRAYRPGEWAPGELPSVGHRDSKAADGASYQRRRGEALLAFVVQKLGDYCPSQTNGVDPLFVSKGLALLHLDYFERNDEESAWISLPWRYGPLPVLWTSKDAWSLYRLAKEEEALFEFKEGRLRPKAGWDVQLRNYFSSSELRKISGYLEVYAKIHEEFRGQPSTMALLTMAACHDRDSTYRYAHRNLALWFNAFDRFLLGLRCHAYPDGSCLNKAIQDSQEMAEMAMDKVRRYRALDETKKQLKEFFQSRKDPELRLWVEDNRVVERLKPGPESPELKELARLAGLANSVSDLVRYLSSRVESLGVEPPKRKRDLSYYVSRAKEEAKGLVDVGVWELGQSEGDLASDTVLSLLRPQGAIGGIFEQMVRSFETNCPDPLQDYLEDGISYIEWSSSLRHWMESGGENEQGTQQTYLPFLMFVSVDETPPRFLSQWLEIKALDGLDGKLLQQDEIGALLVFSELRDALEVCKRIGTIQSKRNPVSKAGVSIHQFIPLASGHLEATLRWTVWLSRLRPRGFYATEFLKNEILEHGFVVEERDLPQIFTDALQSRVLRIFWKDTLF